MKKIFLSVSCCIALVCGAQTKISYDYENKRVFLPAIKTHLSKENSYSLLLPARLKYSGQSEINQQIGGIQLDFRAKWTGAPAEYNFEIVTEGLTGLTKKEPRWFRTEVNDADNIPREVKGFVRDYAVNFSCLLIVKDSKGIPTDTVTIAGESDTFFVSLHRDFLLSANTPVTPNTVIPFPVQDQVFTLESAYADQINKKVEQMAAYQLFRKATSVIKMLYQNYDQSKEAFGYGFIKSKGDEAVTASIKKLNEAYLFSLDSMAGGNWEACRSICSGNIKELENLLSSGNAGVDKNVKEIIYYNLSHAYLLMGNYQQAWKNYELFIGSGVHRSSRLATELRNRISTFQDHELMKKSAN